jgi:hypothetical protein
MPKFIAVLYGESESKSVCWRGRDGHLAILLLDWHRRNVTLLDPSTTRLVEPKIVIKSRHRVYY